MRTSRKFRSTALVSMTLGGESSGIDDGDAGEAAETTRSFTARDHATRPLAPANETLRIAAISASAFVGASHADRTAPMASARLRTRS